MKFAFGNLTILLNYTNSKLYSLEAVVSALANKFATE